MFSVNTQGITMRRSRNSRGSVLSRAGGRRGRAGISGGRSVAGGMRSATIYAYVGEIWNFQNGYITTVTNYEAFS